MLILFLRSLILFDLDYLEFKFFFKDRTPIIDLFIQELADINFEAFEEDSNFIKAFIAEGNFLETKLNLLMDKYKNLFQSHEKIKHPYQNWNEKWESDFEIIHINENCSIRASFHPPTNKIYELIINPEMSFGTGHHETTRLMAKQLFKCDLKDKKVLDFGSGTAILSILSEKLGACEIDAVEIDEMVNENAFSNTKINNTNKINIITGTGENIPSSNYDFLLININRNTIVEEFKYFLYTLKKDSVLILSGFLYTDVDYISKFLLNHELNIITSEVENNWAVLMVKFN